MAAHPPSPGYAPNSDASDDDDGLGWTVTGNKRRSRPPGPPAALAGGGSPDLRSTPVREVAAGGREAKDSNGYGDHSSSSSGPSRKRPRTEADGTTDQPGFNGNGADQFHGEASQMQAMPGAKPHHPMPGLLMKSFFGITPRDEISQVIGQWLLHVCRGLQNVEIELKLGTLIDKRTGQRLSIRGVGTEVVIQDMDVAFRSEMTMRQHRRLNHLLNAEVANCSGQNGPHPHLPPHHYYPITYKHIYHTDTSYANPRGGRGKVRVTRDTNPRSNSSPVIAVVEKETVASIHVHSPREEFDWRVSVNVENPTDMPDTSGAPEMTREKDRLTYRHQLFQVDLTQVKATKRGQQTPPQVIHELEIEISSAAEFLTQGHYFTTNQPNVWEDQLECVVNTIRTLNRNAGPKRNDGDKTGV